MQATEKNPTISAPDGCIDCATIHTSTRHWRWLGSMELWVNILPRLKPGDFQETRTSVQFALQLTLESMPGTTPFGGRRPCTRTLRRHLAQLGRTDMPILVAPIP